MTSLTGNDFRYRNTFLGSLMRQHRSAHHITNGIYVWQIGAATRIHFNVAATVQFQPDIFDAQTSGIRNPPNRDNEFIHFERLDAFLGVCRIDILNRNIFFTAPDAAYLDASLY